MAKKANSRALFLDRKFKYEPRDLPGYETQTVPVVEPDTARGALETLEQTCDEWLHAIAIAATSDARTVIPTIALDLQNFIEATVAAVLTGVWGVGQDCAEHSSEEMLEAARAVTLDEGNWDDWMTCRAARTLLDASARGRGGVAAMHAARAKWAAERAAVTVEHAETKGERELEYITRQTDALEVDGMHCAIGAEKGRWLIEYTPDCPKAELDEKREWLEAQIAGIRQEMESDLAARRELEADLALATQSRV